jgi:hypothetical protein
VLCNLLYLSIVDFLGLAAPEWFLYSQSLHFVNKNIVSFIFQHFRYFVAHKHTWLLEVILFIFQLSCKIMSADSSQRRVRQRTEEAINATLVKVENRQAIPERNVLRADVSMAPLYFIAEIIRDNHWGYLYNSACIVYPRLVRKLFGYLEMVQDEDLGIILQTIVLGHVIQIDPQVISDIIDVPVLPVPASPFTEVVEPPTLEELRDFFHAHPQSHE